MNYSQYTVFIFMIYFDKKCKQGFAINPSEVGKQGFIRRVVVEKGNKQETIDLKKLGAYIERGWIVPTDVYQNTELMVSVTRNRHVFLSVFQDEPELEDYPQLNDLINFLKPKALKHVADYFDLEIKTDDTSKRNYATSTFSLFSLFSYAIMFKQMHD